MGNQDQWAGSYAITAFFGWAYHARYFGSTWWYLEKGRVVICAGGTGNPYFTTDTAAALRGMELKVEAILKATKVDGVYDKDPRKFDDAVRYECVTYLETLEKRLGVMDSTAISLARDNCMPIIVFNLFKEGNIRRVVSGEPVGTIVQGGN